MTPADFDAVIEANAAGKTGPITVTVPAGQTLYVTQHLEWSGLGNKAPTSPATISIAGTVTLPASPSSSCTAGATGSVQ